jgi:hypothetical protein
MFFIFFYFLRFLFFFSFFIVVCIMCAGAVQCGATIKKMQQEQQKMPIGQQQQRQTWQNGVTCSAED